MQRAKAGFAIIGLIVAAIVFANFMEDIFLEKFPKESAAENALD